MCKIRSTRWRAPAWATAGCFALGLACVGSSPAAAQGTPQQRAACEQDAYRLCGQFGPNKNPTAASPRRHRLPPSRPCPAVFSGKGARRSHARQR